MQLCFLETLLISSPVCFTMCVDATLILNTSTSLGWVQGEPFNPEFSPLLYPSHQGLPPAYLQICGGDILRDEGLLYERLLREAEVKTKLDM